MKEFNFLPLIDLAVYEEYNHWCCKELSLVVFLRNTPFNCKPQNHNFPGYKESKHPSKENNETCIKLMLNAASILLRSIFSNVKKGKVVKNPSLRRRVRIIRYSGDVSVESWEDGRNAGIYRALRVPNTLDTSVDNWRQAREGNKQLFSRSRNALRTSL